MSGFISEFLLGALIIAPLFLIEFLIAQGLVGSFKPHAAPLWFNPRERLKRSIFLPGANQMYTMPLSWNIVFFFFLMTERCEDGEKEEGSIISNICTARYHSLQIHLPVPQHLRKFSLRSRRCSLVVAALWDNFSLKVWVCVGVRVRGVKMVGGEGCLSCVEI